MDSFPWQPVPVHTLPLNQDRWGKAIVTTMMKIVFFLSTKDHPQCSGREGWLPACGTTPQWGWHYYQFFKKISMGLLFRYFDVFNIHQAKCYFKCKLILWQYLQCQWAGSRGKGDEKNPWISLGAAWLHLQTLGKADDKCHGGDFTHFKQNSSAM